MSNTPDALRFAYRDPHFIWSIAWSPTGTLLATGNAAGQLHLWNATTGQELACIQGHEARGAITTLCWSSDGNRVRSSGMDGRIVISDVQQAETQHFYQYPQSFDSEEVAGTNDTRACWSPDGHYLASCGYDPDEMMLRLWELPTGTLVQHWPFKRYHDSSDYIATLQWSPDSRWLATGDNQGTVHLWDPFNGTLLAAYEAPRMERHFYLHYIRSIVWSPDGRYLACGDNYGCVQVWDTQQHRRRAIYSPDAAAVEEEAKRTGMPPFPISTHGLAWLPDGTLASAHHSVQIHDPVTGTHLATVLETLQIEKSYVLNQVIWSPDWKTLASVGGYRARGNEKMMDEEEIDEEAEDEETGDAKPLYEGFLHLWRWQPAGR